MPDHPVSLRTLRTLRWPLLAVTLLLCGCGIGGRSPAVQYHMLTARAPAGDHTLATTIGVGPVRVAPFLTRPPIVTHAGGGSIQVAEGQRWGEPLDQGVQRALLQNLAALTGAGMRSFPWRQRAIPQYAVRLEVLDLDRQADGSATLEATWQLENIAQGKLLQTRTERLSTPIAGSGYSALTDAYSELVAQLAQHIAAAVIATAGTE